MAWFFFPIVQIQISKSAFSVDPLAINTDDVEDQVWQDYYHSFSKDVIEEVGVSSTVCFVLWQVFNRMADEQYYPPALPKVDILKILSKCAKVSF